MTMDPKQNGNGDREGERISQEKTLEAITKKVDEKLSQLKNKSFDEEMERHLEEIQELRRKEKEALEQSRSTRRQKRQKDAGRREHAKEPEREDVPAKGTVSRGKKEDAEDRELSSGSQAEQKASVGEPEIPKRPETDQGQRREHGSPKDAGETKQAPKPWKPKKRSSIYPTREELEKEKEAVTDPAGEEAFWEEEPQEEKRPKKDKKEKKVSIAQLAAQAVAEAEAAKSRIAQEQEAAAQAEAVRTAEKVMAAGQSPQETSGEPSQPAKAEGPGERSGAGETRETSKAPSAENKPEPKQTTEDERVAKAVDRFFDTAEQIAAEEGENETFGQKLSAFVGGLASAFSKKGKKKGRGGGKGPGGTPGGDGASGDGGPQGEPAGGVSGKEESNRGGPDQISPGGPADRPADADQPSRAVDEAVDALFRSTGGFFAEAGRLTKELHHTRKGMEGENHLTHEKRMARYRAVWAAHLRPLTCRLQILGDWMRIRQAQFSAWCGERAADVGVRKSLIFARAKVLAERGYIRGLRMLVYAEKHKMKMFACFSGAVACALVAGLVIGHLTAYEYMYNGRVLGMVRDQEVVYKTIDVIGGKLSESLEADIEIDKEKDISFRKVIGFGHVIDSKDDVLNSLTYMKTLKAKGYAIMADGKRTGVLQSRQLADELLDEITERFSQQKEGVEYKSVGFAQDVKVEEIDTELGNIQNVDEVREYLLTGAVEKKVHVVQKGQTFNAIAKSYGLKPSELQASNPGVNPDKLKIDQELILTQDSPVLTVQTTEVATYNEEIPFEVVYEDTSAYYKGEKNVKLKGVNGQRQVVAEIVRNNGTEVSRTELKSEVLSEPTNQIVLVGTKEKPRTVATGTFSYPVRGARLSGRFGARWGRKHQGIDLAIAKGTTISAADGGTVTFAGYKGSYGYLVIINHGNGMETYYAHCSKLLVSRGAKVYKGQAIAKVGSTGNSTGPHVHFEVHVNGVPRNPLNYL